jgi:hypothetical protein
MCLPTPRAMRFQIGDGFLRFAMVGEFRFATVCNRDSFSKKVSKTCCSGEKW